jgi:hypothetical protein
MAKPIIELPDLPDHWFDNQTSGVAAGTPARAPGIFDGLPEAREWSLADSGLNIVMPPDAIDKIDFSGTAPPEPPPWLNDTGRAADGAGPRIPAPQSDGEGFYTGLKPYTPDPEARRMFRPGLNDHGYTPRPGDAGPLARVIYAEGSNTPPRHGCARMGCR